jgi:hypothetical protein
MYLIWRLNPWCFCELTYGLFEIKRIERFDVVWWLWHNNVLPQKGWQQKN